MTELLATVALLCQVTGSYGSTSVAVAGSYGHEHDKIEFTYEEAADEQLKCQKYYVKCLAKDKTLDKCILERK